MLGGGSLEIEPPRTQLSQASAAIRPVWTNPGRYLRIEEAGPAEQSVPRCWRVGNQRFSRVFGRDRLVVGLDLLPPALRSRSPTPRAPSRWRCRRLRSGLARWRDGFVPQKVSRKGRKWRCSKVHACDSPRYFVRKRDRQPQALATRRRRSRVPDVFRQYHSSPPSRGGSYRDQIGYNVCPLPLSSQLRPIWTRTSSPTLHGR
jgi:hypothetical protein